jgi:steroid delta-isomerase-like uncharacterized protein
MGEAMDVGERWFEAARQGDVDAMVAVMTEDCDFMTPGGPVSDPHQAAVYVKGFREAFPDAGFNIHRWIESGDTAVAEGSYTGTHTGTLTGPGMEVPATGKSIDVPFVTIFGTRNGRMSSHHAHWDQAAFMIQLGLMPAPGG